MNNKTNTEKKKNVTFHFNVKMYRKNINMNFALYMVAKKMKWRKKRSTGIMERERLTRERVWSSSSLNCRNIEIIIIIIIIENHRPRIIMVYHHHQDHHHCPNVRPDSMQCECDNNLVRSDNCIQWWWWWWWIWPLEYVKNFTLIIIIIINGEKNLFERKKTTTIVATAVVYYSSSMSCVDHHHDQWMIKKKPIQINTWPRQTINKIKEKKTKIIKDKGEQQQKWKDHEIEQIVCVSSVCMYVVTLIFFVTLCIENINIEMFKWKKNEKEEENYYWINKNFGWKFETENRLHCLIKIKKNSRLDSSKDNQSWISFDRKKTKRKVNRNRMRWTETRK